MKRETYNFLFCENQRVIKNKLKYLDIKAVQDDNIDGVLYIDRVTGQTWEVYTYDDFETYRKPYPKGLRVYPYPKLEKIIDVICLTAAKSEIEGACRFLLEQEYLGVEFRE